MSLRQQAYEYIQQQIVDGSLAGGMVVSEQQLAKELGISRTPVREAIGQLQTEGLLEQLPKRGTLVRRLDQSDLIELYEVREAVESYTASRAAKRIDGQSLSQLRAICEQMQNATESLKATGADTLTADAMRRYLALDTAYHMVLIQAAGNRRIFKIVSDSRVLMRVLWSPRQEHDLDVLTEAHRQHTQILHHVSAGESEQAGAAMADHIRSSLKRAMDHLNYNRTRDAMAPAVPDDLLSQA